jgi:peptidoglycan/LPS O-acetylase OafA/YrhL
MLTTIGLAFVAGFFLGNGLPYYLQGSTGEGRHPAPFPDRPWVSVVVGCVAFAIAAVAWHFADVGGHPFPAGAAALLGLLAVALIHTRTWRDANPWGKRTSA